VALYRALRERQPVPYGAVICLPNGEAVLSLSPELFIRHQQGTLFARPMKGTAAATGDDVIDHTIGEQLRNDGKNRAENLMIVDLLRNDLGRIAQTGTVRVPQLFEVNRFSSVLQMTSSIEADLRPDLSLDAIMSALFPCGSITGAPKRRTMEIIREIESEARGIYTGAIGWFDPPGEAANIGDFCLSVPIRTLHLSRPDQQGVRQGMMGVGAGIVYDSQAQDEFEECQLKARFLTGLQANFELFETMYATKEDGCRHWLRHLGRLRASASYFEFPFYATILEHKIRATCGSFLPNTSYRLRLALRSDGEISLQHAPLAPLPEVVNLLISQESCETPALFLAHKSSHRQQYDNAWQDAEKRGAFDQLFINSQGMVTEGGRSNVFIRCGEQWFTPPLSDGVLPGIMRAVLLSDTTMNASEKSCTLHELENADQIIVCNALRGILQAQLVS
jgi:para-aminobenzoate synthetase/4-amino-4-deoxychorismate lyase